MADTTSLKDAIEAAKGGYRGLLVKRDAPVTSERRAEQIAVKQQKNAYLSKYLSGGDAGPSGGGGGGGGSGGEKKLRKKKKPGDAAASSASSVKIIDTDYDWKRDAMPTLEQGDDAPVLVRDDARSKKPTTADDDADDADALAGVRIAVNDGSGWSSSSTTAPAANSKPKRLPSPDQSPPRRTRIDSPDAGALGGAKPSAADLSPPRRKREPTPDLSPPRNGAAASRGAPDLSPPRRSAASGASAPDLSPPRKSTAAAAAGGDLSPPRKRRVASPDLSPPRKGGAASFSSSSSSSNHRDSKHSGSTATSTAKPTSSSSSSGSGNRERSRSRTRSRSPKRRRVASPDQSPPRRRVASPDQSPPRKAAAANGGSDAGSGSGSGSASGAMTDSGVRSGLRRGSEYGAEALAAQRKQMEALERLGADASGEGAATIVRDKRGRKLTPEELAAKQARQKSSDAEQKGMEWGKGLAQASAARSRRDDDAHEAAKPFARYKDDADLDALQRDTVRWGDPLALLNRKNTDAKRKASAAIAHSAAAESVQALAAHTAAVAAKASGSGGGGREEGGDSPDTARRKLNAARALEPKRVVQRRPRPMYQGAAWPNRYGIRPGYRWDGVVRGNGWEDRLAMTGNRKKLLEHTAYKWSSEDM